MSPASSDPATDEVLTSQVLRSLMQVTRAHPYNRKRLIAPDVNSGRELLVTLARATGGWIGWEATTLRGLAGDLAFVSLAEQGIHLASDIQIAALINRALQETIEQKRIGVEWNALSRSLGVRRALRDTLLELRVAGVTPDTLRQSTPHGSPASSLAPLLETYERLLTAARLADPSAVFRVALESFDREAEFVLDGVTVLVPSLSRRGMPGELVTRLLSRGAQLLDTDTGAECPIDPQRVQVDLCAAATPSDEIREVYRRVLAEGRRWDEVEIVTTDPDTYGIAVDALNQQLGVRATLLHGVPLARTRLGRALERWFAWLDDGLPSDVLRQALEAGEVTASGSPVAPAVLARELRTLRIGWGRARYDAALARLEDGRRIAEMRQREDESDESFTSRCVAHAEVVTGLAALLRTIFSAMPEVPERGSERGVYCSCAALANATLAYLQLFRIHDQTESQTMERLCGRLTELVAVDDMEATFANALATLRDALADLRAWPLVTGDRTPWSSAGGMPHMTDVASAGATGRRRVFVVGLDAARTNGGERQDPLLPDALRRAIAPDDLATSATHRAERAYTLAASLATLRGQVTLSYAMSGAGDGRDGAPSPILLQTWRLMQGDTSPSYDDLRRALTPPVSAVPQRRVAGTALLDARDVWFDALADGALLLDGTAAVREAFPLFAAGLAAHALAGSDQLTVYHGLVTHAGPVLDPSADTDRAISPSSLELLAACPLAWFYRYGLSLIPPMDPEYDVERWLDPLQRGQLLHAVYEAFTQAHRRRQEIIVDPMARTQILAIAEVEIARWSEQVPPPSETVFEVEAAEIRDAALAFLRMECDQRARGDRGRWWQFEISFGFREPPGIYRVDDGRTLRVRGRADRLDELPDGTLRVVDYKTGTATPYGKSPKDGPFNGGRQLQPALYAAAIETVSGRPVSLFEYRFPTDRGNNETVVYTTAELTAARATIGSLLDHVRAGEFIPTTDTDDCAFCDYNAICRVQRDKFGKTDSPRAAWAEAHAETLPVYTPMLTRRGPATSSV